MLVFALFAVTVSGVQLGSEYNYKKSILQSRLAGYADIFSRSEEYAQTARLLPQGVRVTVIRPDGRVLYDSDTQSQDMDNHLSRPEIAQCLEGGDGCSIRRSKTSRREYIYFARRYADRVVRTALPFEVEERRFMHPDWVLLLTTALLFITTALIIARLTKKAGVAAERSTEKRLQSQKRRITSNLSHELRTPLTSIRAYLETLVENPALASEKRELFTRRAYQQTLRLSELVRDISLITKMEEAPEMMKKERIDLGHVIEEVCDELRENFHQRKIKVENTISHPLLVNANQTVMYALFRNLFENSIRYAGEGITIRIEAKLTRSHVLFSYQDNGKGVAREHLEKIFERFYRVAGSEPGAVEGSGLGLSIVRNAVIIHSGSIEARQVSPHGLEFRFSVKIR